MVQPDQIETDDPAGTIFMVFATIGLAAECDHYVFLAAVFIL
jgi:hypothetical protein